ncbi:VOC family protein [Ruegeria sp. 2205SS24-7]|uniref:VOC family protein n=1 Tax=Ruegeria discodermiae TaxID=3064389 RepID=UPI002741483A|nr:VOC family protein [Ruegeria sp. 2205SS24-7]MDP5220778.1 VOC family protein [Ruegeria sp. 2205SS24-7]
MAKAIHSMIRVLDETASCAFYEAAFDLKVADRLDFENFTLVYLANKESSFELELTINKDTTEAYDRGSGYGHFAVTVEDLNSEHARMTELGLAPRKIVDFSNDGKPVARFFFIQDPDGYEIEVLERGGRYL